MATLDWEQSRQGGVTLVELCVTTETPEQIRVESQLRPVWPPRKQGIPAAGWDRDGFEGAVDPTTSLVLGYASPAPPVEPPAQVEQREGETDPTGTEPRSTGHEPEEIVRALGQSAPMRDAVPTDRSPQTAAEPESKERAQPTAVPPWFERVEQRLDDAERLTGISGADEARGAIDALGGIERVRELKRQLDQDREKLERLERRQRTLASRLATLDIPVATLERVT